MWSAGHTRRLDCTSSRARRHAQTTYTLPGDGDDTVELLAPAACPLRVPRAQGSGARMQTPWCQTMRGVPMHHTHLPQIYFCFFSEGLPERYCEMGSEAAAYIFSEGAPASLAMMVFERKRLEDVGGYLVRCGLVHARRGRGTRSCPQPASPPRHVLQSKQRHNTHTSLVQCSRSKPCQLVTTQCTHVLILIDHKKR